jgi:hypothetical protein
VPPISRPFPRFVADSPQEGPPYGRWAERLTEELGRACEPLAAEAGGSLDPESVRWFPERAWGGRIHVPVSARTENEAGDPIEYFGHLSFERPEGEEARDLRASMDFTDITVEDNPDWKIDLNDAVVGTWRADGGRGGDVTLVWGVPLVRGAVAATAELDGEVLDQAAVNDGRFTLVAVDALHGFGDELYLEVRLWDRNLRELAAESLYAEPEEEGAEAEGN